MNRLSNPTSIALIEVGHRRPWWVAPAVALFLGSLATVGTSLVPTRLQARDADRSVGSITAGLAQRLGLAVSSETALLGAVASSIDGIPLEHPVALPLPADVAPDAERAKSLFRTVVLVGPVDPDDGADPLVSDAPALAHAYRQVGMTLVPDGMSIGPRLGQAVRSVGLPIVPDADARAVLRLVDPAQLPEAGVLGRLDRAPSTSVSGPAVGMLAVPVPGIGWLISALQPAGLDELVSPLPMSPTLTVSFHAGIDMAAPLLAQSRASVPPPAEEVRWWSRTVGEGEGAVTVIVGADRHFGTRPVVAPAWVLMVGFGVSTAFAGALGARSQRRHRRILEAQLVAAHRAARTDPLTGLRNRLGLDEDLDAAAVDAGRGGSVAVILGDLDRFKVINDARGHDVGDDVLVEVARRLRAITGTVTGTVTGAGACADATVARFGGDEFVIVLRGAIAERAVDVAEAAVAAIRRPFTVGADAVVIGVSVGLVCADGPAEVSRSTLLRDADLAMYVAKRNGGNRVAVAGSESIAGGDQLDLEIAIRAALGTDALRTWYQPLVDADREVQALEALIRWEHPERGMLAPGLFLPAAKEAGLLAELSTVVLARACDDVARWNVERARIGLNPIVVHVNTVEEQLLDAGFADVVGAYLQASGLDPACLILEISEETALDRLPATVPTLELMRAMGVRFSIDDFGFGNSSLAMVRRVGDVAELKIDKSIVDGLAPGAAMSALGADLAVIRAITEFARSQGISVVAEGIEHMAQFEALSSLGVELFQGYLFHRPQPAAALEGLLAGSRQVGAGTRGATVDLRG